MLKIPIKTSIHFSYLEEHRFDFHVYKYYKLENKKNYENK